jgi:nucleoside 2-deoxyribosyltransferase
MDEGRRQLKFYIATGLENGVEGGLYEQAKGLIESLGHTITYDWSVHGPVWREGRARLAEVAQQELNGVYLADVVLVLLPGGRGTHVELGAALVQRKPVILWKESPDHFGADANTSAFYHLPRIFTVSGPLSEIARVILGAWWDGQGV